MRLMATISEDKKDVISRDILPILPQTIKQFLNTLTGAELSCIEEIRLRKGKPLLIKNNKQDFSFDMNGKKTYHLQKAYKVSGEEIKMILQVISNGSFYALEQELRNGYITIKGGHRIGLAGEAVVEKGILKTLKKFSSLNIRIAREFIGCADEVLPYLVSSGKVLHTLIISPPGYGKTTLLRDLVRQISDGKPNIGLSGKTVGVVDERSEIAGTYNGIPQHQVGFRTDILDKCPKAQGMIILVRSMAPEVIVTDELGGENDIKACQEILNAGISLLATAHGSSIEELRNKAGLKELISSKIFRRYVVLQRNIRPGSVCDILNENFRSLFKNGTTFFKGG